MVAILGLLADLVMSLKYPCTLSQLGLLNKALVLTEECDICMAEEGIFSHSAHKAVFGHTRYSLALLLPRFAPFFEKCTYLLLPPVAFHTRSTQLQPPFNKLRAPL